MDPNIFIQQSLNGLRTQTAAHNAGWHLDKATQWSADQDSATLFFTFADGLVSSASFQIVGTYSGDDESFLWGWDHPSVLPTLRKHAQLAREWGDANGMSDYTTPMVQCSQDKAWEFVAVAARLGEANGAYRGPSGSTYIFMTFGQISLQKQQ
ncbi:MAG TPA: hypothetical protein VN025_13455 [Candidatus Dormibacteraeota bacterium]|jgi:hypothetical protein|nr:hypothetical protein [Candidatus Dormibacteraeota bacterium]